MASAHTFKQKLLKMLAVYESAARAIRTTITLLDGDSADLRSPAARYVANGGAAGIEAEALALDAERRGKRRGGRKRVPGGHTATVRANRTHTAAVLAQFDHTEPRRMQDVAIPGHTGPMVARGYLRKKGKGYIRTAKPFHVDPGAAGE